MDSKNASDTERLHVHWINFGADREVLSAARSV